MKTVVPPSWCVGHVSLRDAVFIQETICSKAPRQVLEIGDESGHSSVVILQALQQLENPLIGTPELHSYDIVSKCYFDADHEVGSTVLELLGVPNHWHLHTGKDAWDAGQTLEQASIDIAFIDADHRHTFACLDLIGLLPSMKE